MSGAQSPLGAAERSQRLLAAQNLALDSPRNLLRLVGVHWDVEVFWLLISLILCSPKAATAPRIPPTRLALHHFDINYSLQLKELWPSVRAGLLCEQKYGALLNNFSLPDHVTQELELLNATDFVSEATKKARSVAAAEEVGRGKSSEGRMVMQVETMTQAEMSPPLRASISSNIKCYTFPRGDITRFRPAR